MKKLLFTIILLFLFLTNINFVLADTVDDGSVKFIPQVSIPGTEFTKGVPVSLGNTTTISPIGKFIKGIYDM